MTQHDQTPFLLDDILVSPQHNMLSLQGRTLSLQPKVMAVLCYLAQHRERVVSNDELLDQVWQGRVVTHASVQKSMNTLRNALAELAGEREFVAHFSKRGYQLVVPVSPLSASATPGPVIPEPALPASAGPVETPDASGAAPGQSQRLTSARLIQWAGLPLSFCLLGVLIWLAKDRAHHVPPQAGVDKAYATTFANVVPVTENGHRERLAEPHPDGKRIAYIRDSETHDGAQSEILIREVGGADWTLASVEGTWADLAWSPSGRNLVALEIRRADGLPWSPDYFEKPNYLYSFHIFTLDFRGERLLEKNLLSQWQGVVKSVAWWDDNTLEFVASLGPTSANERYRYAIAEQKLSALNPPASGFAPLQSVVQEKSTAVVTRRRNVVQLEVLDSKQQRVFTAPLASAAIDVSWIPDGSGLLIFEREQHALYTLDLNGNTTPVTIPVDTPPFSHPRYTRDGQGIVLTTFKIQSQLVLLSADNAEINLQVGANEEPLAGFTPEGQVIFSAEEHGRYQLRRWREGREEILATTEQPVEFLMMSDDGQWMLYRSGGSLWQMSLRDLSRTEIWKKSGAVEPVAFAPDSQEIIFIRRGSDASNLWWRNVASKEERQLTFGSVGAAIAAGGKLYFQYTGQRGLWLLNPSGQMNLTGQLTVAGQNPLQVSRQLPDNSQLLRVEKNTVYFVSGGPCHETSLQSLDLLTDEISVVRERSQADVISRDFEPSSGVLQVHCAYPETRIVELRAAPQN